MDRVKYKIAKRYTKTVTGQFDNFVTFVAGIKGGGVIPSHARMDFEVVSFYMDKDQKINNYLVTFTWEVEE